MKRKILCVALALLMCMMVAVPTFADDSAETPPDRAPITATFGLKKLYGFSYSIWARIGNPCEVSVTATLGLFNDSYSPLYAVTTTSTNPDINLDKYILMLGSGTYHVILSYTAEGSTHTFEKTYSI